jgi:hypothetical protein
MLSWLEVRARLRSRSSSSCTRPLAWIFATSASRSASISLTRFRPRCRSRRYCPTWTTAAVANPPVARMRSRSRIWSTSHLQATQPVAWSVSLACVSQGLCWYCGKSRPDTAGQRGAVETAPLTGFLLETVPTTLTLMAGTVSMLAQRPSESHRWALCSIYSNQSKCSRLASRVACAGLGVQADHPCPC